MTSDYPKGVRPTSTGWQVFVRVDRQYKSRRFPPETTIPQLIEARERLKAEAKYGVPPPANRGGPSFRKDAAEYLTLAAGMPSFKDRKYRIEQWVEAFGDRPRQDITVRDIRLVLEKWRLAGRADGEGLSPASLNQRRTALMAMYTVLDGKSAANIVKDVPAYDESPSAAIRAVDMLTIARIIRRVSMGSQTRARLRVLQWTGWPHQLLAGITEADVDWTRARVRLAYRKKGKGMAAAWVPILPRAVSALRRFFALKCAGTFSRHSMSKTFKRATQNEGKARQVTMPAIRVYDIRHSFATWAAGVIKDDRALTELLRTKSIARYTEAATAGRLESARDQLAGNRKVAAATLRPSSAPVDPQVATSRKLRLVRKKA